MVSIYIHIPFCQYKCLYCSFVVSIGKEHHIDAYIKAVLSEMRMCRREIVGSIYVGGGTPTHMNEEQLLKLIEGVGRHFILTGDTEFTVEANPEDFTDDKMRLLFQNGVNRISLGVQSLNDDLLTYLGRKHTARQARDRFQALRRTGFDNISCDLMYSFPGQTLRHLTEDVDGICQWGCDHVSLYTLTVEENSRFFVRQVPQESAHKQSRQYELVRLALAKSGYRQYEISNFARQGKLSQHNVNCWRGGNYIGLGVGAHSHLDGVRAWNEDRLQTYMERIRTQGHAVKARERLAPEEKLRESALLGLRMNDGVDLDAWEKRFGLKFSDEFYRKIFWFADKKLLIWQPPKVMVTDKGRLVLDEICGYLI
jgi:oxygen-independent coproporphyrinogen-3 oxidase